MNVASGRSHGDLRTWLILAKVWGKSVDQLMVQVWGVSLCLLSSSGD